MIVEVYYRVRWFVGQSHFGFAWEVEGSWCSKEGREVYGLALGKLLEEAEILSNQEQVFLRSKFCYDV